MDNKGKNLYHLKKKKKLEHPTLVKLGYDSSPKPILLVILVANQISKKICIKIICLNIKVFIGVLFNIIKLN